MWRWTLESKGKAKCLLTISKHVLISKVQLRCAEFETQQKAKKMEVSIDCNIYYSRKLELGK